MEAGLTKNRGSRWLHRALWLVFIGYGVFHFYFIVKTAIDIPYMDEWDLFGYDRFLMGWNAHFLLGFMNEHRSVAAKLLLLLNYQIFGLNFRYQVIFNFLLYFGLLYLLWRTIGKKIEGGSSLAVWVAFFVLLSPYLFEVHSMAFLGGKHLYLIAFVAGFYLLFFKPSLPMALLGSCLLVFAAYSFAGCVAGVLAGMLVYWVWNFVNKPPNYLLTNLMTFIFIGQFLLLWPLGIFHNPSHPPYAFPWDPQFFVYFSEIVSLGFGFDEVSPVASFFCVLTLVTVLGSFIYLTVKNHRDDSRVGFLLAVTIGVIGILTLITIGRSGFPLSQSKAARYAEIAMLLPLLILALTNVYPKLWNLAKYAVVTLLALGFWNNLSPTVYQQTYLNRLDGKKCLINYIHQDPKVEKLFCPTIYPFQLNFQLRSARYLGVHFARGLKIPR